MSWARPRFNFFIKPLARLTWAAVFILLPAFSFAQDSEDANADTLAFEFFIPSAFTPNGDGYNDVFYGDGDPIVSQEITIYDRRGALIFKSSLLDDGEYDGWNGRVNNGWNKVPQGVYLYTITVVDAENRHHRFLGHVTLIL